MEKSNAYYIKPIFGWIKMKEIQILNDYPVSDAKFFNFGAYADAISRIIQSKNTGTPLVIGIIGDWGSGKTSLMKTIENKIGKKENGHLVQTIWFNAWKFDKEGSVRRALLMRVLEELKVKDKNDDDKNDDEKKLDQDLTDLQESLYHDVYREELGKLNFDWGKAAKGTFKLSLSSLPFVGSNLTKLIEEGTNEKAIKNILDSIYREKKITDIEKVQSIEKFHDRFEDTIKKYYVAKNKNVVIFIDDLDRSLPEKALEVLDAIKLFLDVEGCIFILGIDRRVISYIISGKYRKLIGNGEDKESKDIIVTGENYLEKIIQLSFELPPIKDDDIKKFINSLEGMDSEFYGQFYELITQGIENNPRKIKRFFNIIELQRNIVEAMNLQKGLTEVEQLIYNNLMMVWTIISLNHSKFRDAVLSNQLILKPVLFRAIDEYFGFKEQFENQSEQSELVESFLSDKSLSNLVAQFHETINKHEDKIKSEKITEMKLNDIIEQVISLGSVMGGKVEAKEIIDLRNQTYLLINEVETLLSKLGDISPEQKNDIKNVIVNAKEALKGDDIDYIKSLMNELRRDMKDSLQAQLQQQEELKIERATMKQKVTPISEKEEEVMGELNKAIKERKSLAGKNLREVYLKGINLSFMNLEATDLSKANLENAKLTHAKLNKAVLENATLNGAKLNNAKLWYANLKWAKLENTSLKDAELYRADLSNANLSNADLYNAGLMSVNMEGTIIRGANLSQVNLKRAIFNEYTDFRGATVNSLTINNLGGSNWEIALWDESVREEIKKRYEK